MANLALAVIYFTVFFFGIIGNAIVLFVLLRQRRGWSVTTAYLFNLALSDVLFLCVLPFWGHQYLNGLDWAFGLGWCKIVGSVTSINMYASVFFLTAMSADRYMAVVHATSVNVVRSSYIARWVCVAVWFAALLLSLPQLIHQTLHPIFYVQTNSTNASQVSTPGESPMLRDVTSAMAEVPRSYAAPESPVACTFYIPAGSSKALRMGLVEFTRSMLGFVVPMIVISVCYAKIVITVKKKVIGKRVRKDRVAKLAALVVLAFFFCWLPMQIMKLFSALGGWWKLRVFEFDEDLYNTVYPFMVALAYSNSCINPVVYAFTTTNFQENIKDICGSDKAARPYKMTLSPQQGHNGDPKTGFVTKTEALNMYSPCPKRNMTAYSPAVQVHAAEVSPEHMAGNPHPSQSNGAESQSFSYYSCPAVMQGLGKSESCHQPSVVAHSEPLDNAAFESIVTDAV